MGSVNRSLKPFFLTDRANIGLLLIVTCFILENVHGFMISIDPGIENECFHERVPAGVKLGFSFEVVEGGFYDIDILIKNPNNVILHQADKSSDGKFTFESDVEGPYYFCFSNVRSSYNPKLIIFDIDRSDGQSSNDSSKSGDKAEQDEQKVNTMVKELRLAVSSVKHELSYLSARDRVHRQINEATNSRVVVWAWVEFLVLLAVSLGQVFYLKRFFEVKRVI